MQVNLFVGGQAKHRPIDANLAKGSWFLFKHLINTFTFTITLFKHQASHSKQNEPFQVVDRLAPALLLFFAQPRPGKIFCIFKVLLIKKWENRS